MRSPFARRHERPEAMEMLSIKTSWPGATALTAFANA